MRKKKVYKSNIDMFLAALTDTCSITLIAYYVSNEKVQTHIFKPPNATSLTYLEKSHSWTL